MKRYTKQLHVVMTPELMNTLKEAAAADDLTINAWVREAIKEKAAKSKPWWPSETRGAIQGYHNREVQG